MTADIDDVQEMIDDCYDALRLEDSRITEWEAGFIDDVYNSDEPISNLTDNQVASLTKIWYKLNR